MRGNVQKRIVTIGGGTGAFTVLTALKQYPVELTAVVSMADDGGSTGMLRDQYGVLPPGDIRRALVALSPESEVVRALFNHRFYGGGLHGHNFGNIFLSAAEQVTGDFGKAISVASRVLGTRGTVLPVTKDHVRLMARLPDGSLISGESAIDIPRTKKRSPIQHVWLSPKGRAHPEALTAISQADAIIIGPGDLFTSIIPNFLVLGIARAVKRSRAKKIFIINLMTKRGETDNFLAHDFLSAFERYAGVGVVDVALINNEPIDSQILRKYKKEGAVPVLCNATRFGRTRVVAGNMLDEGRIVRHHPSKFGKIIMKLL
jgi:uncharacterized cofD-like protein